MCAGKKLKIVPQAAEPEHPNGVERFSALAFEELRKWRRELSQSLQIAPFLIFNDDTLRNLSAVLPGTREEFMAVKGTGETKWERFGPAVTRIAMMARAAGDVPSLATAALRKRRR